MNTSAAWRQEWRQHRRLVRLSYARLMDAMVASRGIDAEHFLLWGTAFLTTPMLYAALIWPTRYLWLRHHSMASLHEAVLSDRVFFIVWPMLVALLVGALTWEALFPDRDDQQVLGVLPVRSRTVAAARLSAALLSVTALTTAISLPAAAVYAAGGAVDPSVGTLVGIFVGQTLAAVSAGVAAFSVLLVVRATVTLIAGASGAARVALALQVGAVVGTVEAFMFLPGIQRALMQAAIAPGAGFTSVAPPGWFLGVYALFAGPRPQALLPLLVPALLTLGTAVVSAVALYLLPARLNARRAVERRHAEGRRATVATALQKLGHLLPAARERARFRFVILTLARSRRHSLMVATFVGVGLAVSGTPLVSANLRGRVLDLTQPTAAVLAIPLALTYALVLGLRSAFAVPSDLGANWAFRVAGPRSLLDSRAASRLVYLVLAVLPVSLVLGAVGASWWTARSAAGAAVLHAVSGLALSELALRGHEGVPFTKARGVSANAMKIGAIVAAAGLLLFAFRLSAVHAWALGAPSRVWACTLGMTILTVVTAWMGRREAGRTPASFEAPEDHAITQMKLSEASV
ncbi:MAG: hypothetical protein R2745_01950 [Vicinamibacterales bacterium]